MGLHIHAGDRPDGVPPMPLEEACARNLSRLRRAILKVQRGRGGYTPLDRYVDVIQPGESHALDDGDVDQSSPQEIAEAVWRLACDHADSHGPAYYRVEFYDLEGKKLDQVSISVTTGPEGRPEAVEGGNREFEIVDMARVSSKMAHDSHAQHMKTMEKMTGMLDGVAKMADVQGRLHVEIAKFDHEHRMRSLELQVQMQEDDTSLEKWRLGMGPMVEIGKRIGDVLGGFLNSHLESFAAGAPGGSNPRLETVRSVWEKSDTGAIRKKMKAMDPEIETLWNRLLESDDDATMHNVWVTLVARVHQKGSEPLTLFAGSVPDQDLEKMIQALG